MNNQLQSIVTPNSRGYHQIQMVQDNYDILHNPYVRLKYPNLYREVKEHDRISTSSWYDLNTDAYNEYLLYIDDASIGYYE